MNIDIDFDLDETQFQILQIILGDEVVEDFIQYLKDKKRDSYIQAVKKPITNEKKFIVDVSRFDEEDLLGYWEYDECYIDDYAFIEPKWFKKFDLLCYSDQEHQHVVVFKGAEKARDEVRTILKRLNETGRLTDKFELPENGRYSLTKLHPEKYIDKRDTTKDSDILR